MSIHGKLTGGEGMGSKELIIKIREDEFNILSDIVKEFNTCATTKINLSHLLRAGVSLVIAPWDCDKIYDICMRASALSVGDRVTKNEEVREWDVNIKK